MSGRGDPGEARAQATAMLALLHQLPPHSDERRRVRDRLVEMHLPLVEYLARRFSGRSEPVADLVQVGAIGLLKAIDRFDPERGVEFSTYAAPTIVGEIKRHFRDTGWLVHVPRRAQELQTTLGSARAELSQELGRAPTVAELAERAGLGEDEVLDALEAARGYAGVPLDALTEPGSGRGDHPALADTSQPLERVEQRALLLPAIKTLPPREQEILMLRFLAGKTQTEIAGIVGVSQMQVSRLIARSLATLRDRLGVAETAADAG